MITIVSQQGQDPISFILNIIYMVSFGFFIFYGNKLQTWMMIREVGGAVERLKKMRNEIRQVAISAINKTGKQIPDPTPKIDHFIEYFTIMPTDLDPAGIIPKLDHLIDTYDKRLRDDISQIIPGIDDTKISNMEGVLETAIGLNSIYKLINHFYLLGKKTMSLYVIMQVQMQIPLIMQIAEAYLAFGKAFSLGQPVGDGAGELVAAKLMYGQEHRELAKDIVSSEILLDNRKILVLKAKGPGANVGKPGEAIKKLIEENEGKVTMVIMIDAAGKYEGEKSGETAEGMGSAIGGIGVDKFIIEEITLKYKLPINAVIIKESIEESMAPMTKEINDGVDLALAKVKRIIHEKTKEGDTVIVAGIGNTVGIGQ